MYATEENENCGRLTLLFPATKQDPSEATVTDRMGISSSGTWDFERRVREMGIEVVNR